MRQGNPPQESPRKPATSAGGRRLPRHLAWLVDTGQRLKTADAKIVPVLEFRHQKDDKVLSEWARHFRNQYCLDYEIDTLKKGTGCSHAEYLNAIKFPDVSDKPGPSIRSGDFGEILVADYLQYLLDYWVPRTRYCNKAVRNESTKGSDIIGFKILNAGQESPKDTLAVYEAKASLAGKTSDNRLQEAVEDSAKDVTRKAESLNAIKQRLLDKNLTGLSSRVERFQNHEDHPYREVSGAVALFSTECYTQKHATETDASKHPNRDNLVLIVVHGPDMMNLVNELYRRAADEA
ncbi:MAG: DUF1837 domain-containing protein [Chloroflexi bacterium]|nr:DUF1837 domain-containing protein [Chloroflexota bacterium]